MSKQQKAANEQSKSEARAPSGEHAAKIAAAAMADLQAQAAIGRAYMATLAAVQQAQQTGAETQNVLTRAAMSVGIDPTGNERWNWDDKANAFVRT